jgi:hypothetical protein
MGAFTISCAFCPAEAYHIGTPPAGWHSYALNQDGAKWNLATLYTCPKHPVDTPRRTAALVRKIADLLEGKVAA